MSRTIFFVSALFIDAILIILNFNSPLYVFAGFISLTILIGSLANQSCHYYALVTCQFLLVVEPLIAIKDIKSSSSYEMAKQAAIHHASNEPNLLLVFAPIVGPILLTVLVKCILFMRGKINERKVTAKHGS